jgi:hypothetical protein
MPWGIGEFGFAERDPQTDEVRSWELRELLSRNELVAGGSKLRHRAATYTDSGRTGVCSIWSLGALLGRRRKRALTIEVTNRAKLICQVPGGANGLPREQEKAALRRWAAQEGLTLADSI